MQPERFLHGAPYPGTLETPYPRTPSDDVGRIPMAVWSSARVPAGVRLELTGTASVVEITYQTTTGDLGYRGDHAGICFGAWRRGVEVDRADAVLGDGSVRLAIDPRGDDSPVTIYLPEGMRPVIHAVAAVDGTIEPVAPLPRWVAYGGAITQGWGASDPAHCWTAIASRTHGLDLINMGYAGIAGGDLVPAEHIAALPADVITLAFGAAFWSRTPISAQMAWAWTTGFLEIVRRAQPTTPILVMSPFLRPAAEDVPNQLHATLIDLRLAIEEATRARMAAGDNALGLASGALLISGDHMSDGIHPEDAGHEQIAAIIGPALVSMLQASDRVAVSA